PQAEKKLKQITPTGYEKKRPPNQAASSTANKSEKEEGRTQALITPTGYEKKRPPNQAASSTANKSEKEEGRTQALVPEGTKLTRFFF
nr:hypothetical protein [Tanacetum cinerariifolium]